MDEKEVTPPNSDHQQLASRVRDAMAEHDLSQVDVAKQIDVSSTTISQFLSGRYKGDNEEVARKLAVWLETLASGGKVASILDRIDIFTDAPPTTRRILKTLEIAKFARLIAYVAASSGVGKTMAAKHYSETMPSVWYCQFSPDTTSIYATLVEVASAVGISKPPARPDDIRREIVARLTRTHGLLICDEAQHLSQKGFEAIRTLHDRASVGVVFLGHQDLADKIARLPQLDGRVSAPLRIISPKPQDVDALLARWGVNCKRIQSFLRQRAARQTGLRRIAKAYKLASIFALNAGEEVTLNHVERAWRKLAGSTDTATE